METTTIENPSTAADDARERAAILSAMDSFIHQRPGLEYGNYGDPVAYRAELRRIGRDLRDARELLRAVEWRRSITAADLRRAMQSAYSGRLSIATEGGDTEGNRWVRLDYCTGQYWPTEYRRAVAAVLASALWDWTRDHAMPTPELFHNSETGETLQRFKGLRAGDWLRAHFRREFGRRIAARYFN